MSIRATLLCVASLTATTVCAAPLLAQPAEPPAESPPAPAEPEADVAPAEAEAPSEEAAPEPEEDEPLPAAVVPQPTWPTPASPHVAAAPAVPVAIEEPEWQESSVRVTGRVYGLWRLRDRDPLSEELANERIIARGENITPEATYAERGTVPNEFSISTARVGLQFEQGKLLDAELDVELARLRGPSLRDAFVRVKPLRELRFRIGQFKRPFSHLELRSRRRLALIDRGVGNAYLVEDLAYGDRDLGLQIEGRLSKALGLTYAVGVFNGAGKNTPETDQDGSKDLVARLELEPVRWLSVGVNGSGKWFDPVDPRTGPTSALMGGADVRLRLGELRVVAEELAGYNHLLVNERGQRDLTSSTLLLATYEIPLMSTWRVALEPLVRGEILVPALGRGQAVHVLMGTVGANLLVDRYFRLMVQGEVIRPTDDANPARTHSSVAWSSNLRDEWRRENRFMVQAAVDIR